MIYPLQTWEKWEPMRARSWQYCQESAAMVGLEMQYDFAPDEVEDDFRLKETAFLNATAKAFGISRGDVDAGCANGVIEWRNKCPNIFQARCAGYRVTLPIAPRRWDEAYRDWMAKIADMAGEGQGRIFKANKES